jgi:formate transporter
MKRYMTPDEISGAVVKMGVKKANLKCSQTFLLSIFAGMFVAFGAHASITVMQTLKGIDVGLMKFMGAAVFPVGLMLVILAGGELFTSNNLLTFAMMDKKITLKGVAKNWGMVYVGNFAGAVIFAITLYYSGLYFDNGVINASGKLAQNIAENKIHYGFGAVLLRGILCNIIVVLSVWIATGAQDVASKIFACWFPIMLFVLSGFEHSIANMYYLTMGVLIDGNFDIASGIINNLIPATIGNIIGGAVVVPVIYYFAIHRPMIKKAEEEMEE